MTPLRSAMTDYVSMRRNLGYLYSTSAQVLSRFVAFADTERANHITTSLVLRWTRQPSNAQPSTWAARVGIVRCFALWLIAIDPRTEVPPTGLLPRRVTRKRPYIYTDREIDDILRAARKLPSGNGLRAQAYTTFFSLLSVTGMRISEATALICSDVDLDVGIVTVRRTKFGKTRLIPLHPTTSRALAAYAAKRERLLGDARNGAFFTYDRDLRINEDNARHNWVLVCEAAGVRKRDEANRRGRGPRIHDLRHRFAVKTLLNWYRHGVDVEREMPKLATYLGHSQHENTYWYLEAVPGLLRLVSRRLMKHGRDAR